MCKRVVQQSSLPELARLLQAEPSSRGLPARYNIAPGGQLNVVRATRGGRVVEARQWGLVARFFKSPDYGLQCAEVRAENVNVKAAFRMAFRHRRCIVPIDGFYVFRDEGVFALASRGGAPLYVAGLWEDWGEGERALATCAIITVAAGGGTLSRRMPALLPPEHHEGWLGERPTSLSALRDLLAKGEDRMLESFPVSERVRDPEADGPELLSR